MNPLVKGAVGFGTLVGAGGATYGIYSTIQSNSKISTYSEELKDTLLSTTGTKHQTEWGARLLSLQEIESDTKLVDNLKGLKVKNTQNVWTKLRDWCKENISKPIKDKESNEFQNIQNYCTFSVKEKLTGAIQESEGPESDKWKKGHDALKEIENESELDNDLKGAKGKTVDTEIKQAIKNWCTKAYKKPYKGLNDTDYKNASKICISKD